jgi:ring-1,2-phenylacetyl-CoA epoxidase subunit PaaD
MSMVQIKNNDIMSILETIPDPEMPISIVDLGIVQNVEIDNDHVTITVLPTFIGCPALPMIENNIRTKLNAAPGVRDVTVRFVNDPPWSADRITDAGRASLQSHGVTVPDRDCANTSQDQSTVQLRISTVPCPFCESKDTNLDSAFGPTRCRMIYYCNACNNTFEHIRKL